MHAFPTPLAIQEYLIWVDTSMFLCFSMLTFIEKVDFFYHHVATPFHILTLGVPNIQGFLIEDFF